MIRCMGMRRKLERSMPRTVGCWRRVCGNERTSGRGARESGRRTYDELRSEGGVALAERLENPDGGSLLDAVGDVDVDVGNMPASDETNWRSVSHARDFENWRRPTERGYPRW